jgi:hypothetical protein
MDNMETPEDIVADILQALDGVAEARVGVRRS